MFTFDFIKLFEILEQVPGLQRKDWEKNQSGIDRGMEAVFVQRTTREAATYGLAQLRFQAMPELRERCRTIPQEQTIIDDLLQWGTTQGPGASMMIKTISKSPVNSPARVAALAVLRYYHCREDENPAVKAPWLDEAVRAVPTMDFSGLLVYPTAGDFWANKFQTVQRLVGAALRVDTATTSAGQVLASLRSVKGVGPQTAAMTALFSLGIPTPVVDGYLSKLLVNHRLFSGSLANRYEQDALADYLTKGARDLAVRRPEWSLPRIMSSTYLWVCELMRFRCTCGRNPDSDCPLQGLLSLARG